MNENKRLLVGISKVDFKNDEGRNIKGATVFLLSPKIVSENQIGHMVVKYFVDEKVISKIKHIPAVVNLKYGWVYNSKGQEKQVLQDIEFVKPIDLGAF